MRKLLLLCAVLLSPMPASAAVYSFNYVGQEGTTGSGTLETSDTVNAAGGFTITGISGTFAGNAILGLLPTPVSPNFALSGNFTYDNSLFPTNTIVFNRYGIGFSTGATFFNIFNSAADGVPPPAGFPYGLLTNPSSPLRFGTFTIAAVPEPASMALLGIGLLGLGAAMRRRAA